MDWAETVRGLRRKLRLKQGALADLIGVSQTYVSRLEAGLVGPAPHVAVALEALTRAPRTRGLFADLVATVERIPFHCALIEPHTAKGNRLHAISRPAVSDIFGDAKAVSDGDGVDQLNGQIDALMQAGLAEGEVNSATGHWFEDGARDRAWWTLYAPIRDDDGVCHILAVMRPLEEAGRSDPDGPTLEIEPFAPQR